MKPIPFSAILSETARVCMVPEADILSDQAWREVAHARQVFVVLSRLLTAKSYRSIGLDIGLTNSTVISTLRSVRKKVQASEVLLAQINEAGARLIAASDDPESYQRRWDAKMVTFLQEVAA